MRYVRDGLCATCEYHVDRLQRLSDAGIKSHIIAGDLRDGSAEMQENLGVLRTVCKDAVASIGAPNEPDLSGDPNWSPSTRTYQRELWMRVKGDPFSRCPGAGPGGGAGPLRGPPWETSPPTWTRATSIRTPAAGPRCTTSRASEPTRPWYPPASRSWRPRSATTRTWPPPAGIIRRPSARSATTCRAPRSRAFATGSSAATSTSCSTPGRPPRQTPAASRRWRTPSACCAGTCRASQAFSGCGI